ncbi:hypothetical protein [Mucilaginibacter terrae]|uniref:hypothetical protein n=1 Tax=Mucilaginibacter terrae TaxID=1955052 RepID=UPI0036718572
MMKAELQVISQKTVFNDAKNRLIATKDDRFGDFICKYALILGALVAGAMVASGGSLAAIIATVVIATGISLSMCAIVNLFNGGGWKKIHPTAFVEKKNVLTDKSYFSCPIGGTIIPIYDKNIASRQAEIFRNKAITEISMSFIGGYLLGGFITTSIATQAGFGTVASGLGFGFAVNAGVSWLQDETKDGYFGEMTKEQKSSPLYQDSSASSQDMSYYAPKMTGDENVVKTTTNATSLNENKETIIRQGTEDAQSRRVNPDQGSLNNPYNRNKFKAQENAIKASHGKHNYRRSQEWINLQREKAAYNRSLGQQELKSQHTENLKKGGRGFLEGFNPKSASGGLFWAATVAETASSFLQEAAQRQLLLDAINAEAKAKNNIGVFAEKV